MMEAIITGTQESTIRYSLMISFQGAMRRLLAMETSSPREMVTSMRMPLSYGTESYSMRIYATRQLAVIGRAKLRRNRITF